MDVRTICLAILTRGDATGYEIKKLFEEGGYRHFVEASFGSIYPALTALAGDGLVTCTAVPQDGRPDKKVYHLTSRGRLELLRAVDLPTEVAKMACPTLVVHGGRDTLRPPAAGEACARPPPPARPGCCQAVRAAGPLCSRAGGFLAAGQLRSAGAGAVVIAACSAIALAARRRRRC